MFNLYVQLEGAESEINNVPAQLNLCLFYFLRLRFMPAGAHGCAGDPVAHGALSSACVLSSFSFSKDRELFGDTCISSDRA